MPVKVITALIETHWRIYYEVCRETVITQRELTGETILPFEIIKVPVDRLYCH